MQPEDFARQYCDSRETFAKLQTYRDLLGKWQKAINLVGPKTLPEAWARHFADSAQLIRHIPADTKTLMDIGSGAGFPGLVLAILRPDIEVHLVESDDRKAQFLRNVSRESFIHNTMIHVKRIEEMEPVPADLITARALAELKDLYAYCLPWAEANPHLTLLFLKGRAAQDEITAAQALYSFSHETFPSVTAQDSTILRIQALKRN